jgi:hypothetical protein
MKITTVGLDIAKRVFQLHGVDAAGKAVLTLTEPPGEATHWTGRAMANASDVSLRSVQRIWAAHGLQPHRVRRFKLSQDPAFAAKLRDVVGLYLASADCCHPPPPRPIARGPRHLPQC